VADIRQQMTDYLGSSGTNVEIMCTESNSVYTDPGKQTTSIVNGLFMADAIGQSLQTELKGFSWWGLHYGQNSSYNNSSTLYGWRIYGDYGIISPTGDAYPTYYVMKALKSWARGGDSVITASTSFPTLTIYAVKRVDGTLGLLVINKDALNPYQATINLAGFTPDPSGTAYTYGIPQDEAARTGVGSRDIATTALNVTGASFGATFAPYSLTVLTVRPASASVPAAPSNLQARTVGGTEIDLNWNDNSSNETGFKIERSPDGTNFTQIGTVGANVTTYADPGLPSGQRFNYRVRAYNAAGNSAYSNTASAKTR